MNQHIQNYLKLVRLHAFHVNAGLFWSAMQTLAHVNEVDTIRTRADDKARARWNKVWLYAIKRRAKASKTEQDLQWDIMRTARGLPGEPYTECTADGCIYPVFEREGKYCANHHELEVKDEAHTIQSV